MEILIGLQIFEGFKRKRKYNDVMQDLEDLFRLSNREVDEVVPLLAEAAVEIANFKQWKCHENYLLDELEFRKSVSFSQFFNSRNPC